MKKFDFDKKHVQIAILAFLVLVFGILFQNVISNIDVVWNYITKIFNFFVQLIRPFIIAFVIAYFLNPLVRYIEGRKFVNNSNFLSTNSRKRSFSIFITYIVALLCIYLLISAIIPSVVENINQLIITLPANINNMQNLLEKNNNGSLNQFINIFNELTSQKILPDDLISSIFKNFTDMIFNIPKLIASVVGGVVSLANGVIAIILGFVISIYMINDKEYFRKQAKKIISVLTKKNTSEKIFNIASVSSSTFERFVIGKSIDSLIIGIMFFVICLAFDIPYAPLFALIIGVTNMIPYFGPFIGAVPVLIITLTWNYTMFLPVGVSILILQQFDGVILGPKILGDSIGLKPISVIFAILIGGGLFGVPGMFLGAPTYAVIASIINEVIDKNYIE